MVFKRHSPFQKNELIGGFRKGFSMASFSWFACVMWNVLTAHMCLREIVNVRKHQSHMTSLAVHQDMFGFVTTELQHANPSLFVLPVVSSKAGEAHCTRAHIAPVHTNTQTQRAIKTVLLEIRRAGGTTLWKLTNHTFNCLCIVVCEFLGDFWFAQSHSKACLLANKLMICLGGAINKNIEAQMLGESSSFSRQRKHNASLRGRVIIWSPPWFLGFFVTNICQKTWCLVWVGIGNGARGGKITCIWRILEPWRLTPWTSTPKSQGFWSSPPWKTSNSQFVMFF